nr:hypothetical protein [Clostridia bacterium]
VRKSMPFPQILATSRHITMGALELSGVKWDDALCTLGFTAELVGGDEYTVTVNVPYGYEFAACDGMTADICGDLVRLTVTSESCEKREFAVRFEKA